MDERLTIQCIYPEFISFPTKKTHRKGTASPDTLNTNPGFPFAWIWSWDLYHPQNQSDVSFQFQEAIAYADTPFEKTHTYMYISTQTHQSWDGRRSKLETDGLSLQLGDHYESRSTCAVPGMYDWTRHSSGTTMWVSLRLEHLRLNLNLHLHLLKLVSPRTKSTTVASGRSKMPHRVREW